MALDPSALALDQRRAGDVALHAAVQVEIGGGADVSGDDDIRADHRKGAASRGR